MNNQVTVFDNTEFGKLRTIAVDSVVYFVGKDVAEILGYSNTRDALAKHVDDEDKNTVAIHDGIGNPNKTVINEMRLSRLISIYKKSPVLTGHLIRK
jgi:prophage antirepressor-like protein